MAGSHTLVSRFDPALVQARWVLGKISAEELVTEALTALEHGYAGNALQQLAGLVRPSCGDLGALPERAFVEMGLKPLNKEEAIAILLARTRPSDIIASILNTFPGFLPRWKEHVACWGGQPAGPYNDMAEFVHFVVNDLYEVNRIDDVRRVFNFFEQRLTGASQDVRNLIGLGFFETLQNVASWRPYGYQVFEPFLGPTCLKIWREIQRIWAGKSSLMDVLRAERENE